MVELRDLRMGVPAPNFHLMSSRGHEVSVRNYRHRQPVVLFFMHSVKCPACLERLRRLSESYDEYGEWKTEVLAVTPDPAGSIEAAMKRLRLPFPLLFDPMNMARSLYRVGGDEVGIVVLDRWNGLQVRQTAREASGLMRSEEVLGWVTASEISCPECGVSEWPDV